MSRIPRWTRKPGQSQEFLDNLEEETGVLRRSTRPRKPVAQFSPEKRRGRRREAAPMRGHLPAPPVIVHRPLRVPEIVTDDEGGSEGEGGVEDWFGM